MIERAEPASELSRRVTLWGPVVVMMALIFVASAQPDLQLPSGVNDKYSHSLAYAVLGGLIVRALVGGLGRRVTISAAILGILLTTAYGATDEVHQLFVAGRYGDVYDLIADVIGGGIGAFACWLCGIISASRHGL